MSLLSDIASTPSFERIETYDDFLRFFAPPGFHSRAHTVNMRGLSTTNTVKLDTSNDATGRVFMTRPMLALTDMNLNNAPGELDGLITNAESPHKAIRRLLDPRIHLTAGDSALVDNGCAFIPILSNNILTVSGFPDTVLPTFTSKSDVRGGEWGLADGTYEINGKLEIDITWQNTKGDVIPLLVETWIKYISKQYEGMCRPYIDLIANNEMDYWTRIYRLVLDPTQKYVRKIAATGGSFPISVPNGKIFDYSADKAISKQNEVSVRWFSIGMMYNDPRLYAEFNATGALFNSQIRAKLRGQSHSLEKLPDNPHIRQLFDGYVYPLINTNSNFELEWYVDTKTQLYQDIIKTFKRGTNG